MGHRRSVDFDLFKFAPLNHKRILSKISEVEKSYLITRRVSEQLNLTIRGVKFTFFEYPFNIDSKCAYETFLRMPCLLDLAAMKAYALGRRSKWKDYVDLYFLLNQQYSMGQISQRASQLFDQLFSEKMFRSQLSYFEDIDYSEEVEYLGAPVPKETIMAFLTETATKL